MMWRVEVLGESMAPALHEGDRLLVAPAWRLRRGDLVVLRDPTHPARWVVKRLAALPGERVAAGGVWMHAGEGIVVLGDNAAASRDSRSYGPVSRRDVRGRAWYRYAPARRAGRVSRRA